MQIDKKNVSRIAERIAMNELEARGFHIIDLAYMSKTTANVDFIASKGANSFRVQVKGTTNKPQARWAVQYGFCDENTVQKRHSFFNSKTAFTLQADVVVLLAVKSPSNYRAVVMPVKEAEQAAQMNMDGYYRQPKPGGGKRKPHKVWTDLEPTPNPRKQNLFKEKEQAFLRPYADAWETLGGLLAC